MVGNRTDGLDVCDCNASDRLFRLVYVMVSTRLLFSSIALSLIRASGLAAWHHDHFGTHM